MRGLPLRQLLSNFFANRSSDRRRRSLTKVRGGTRVIRLLAIERLEDRTVPSLLQPVPVLNPNLAASDSSGGVSQPFISYDGQYIVYTGTAPSLVAGQTNQAPVANIYLYNTQTQVTTLVSHVPGESTTGANAPSAFPFISGDDRFVAYLSEATDLVPGQQGPQTGIRGPGNVFLYDISTGTNILVSHAVGEPTTSGNDTSSTEGTTGFGLNDNSGRYLLFMSYATNLVSGQDNSGRSNLFLYDTQEQTITLISHAPGSTTTGGNDDTYVADISQDGSIIVFASLATNLVANEEGTAGNVFEYDNRTTVSGNPNPTFGDIVLVSGTYDQSTGMSSDTIGAGNVTDVAISADTQTIVYISSADDLVASQSTDFDSSTDQFFAPTPNVFGRSPFNGTTYLLSGATTPSGPSASVTSNGTSVRLAISGNGGSVAFISDASDLYPTQSGAPGSGRNSGNVFVANLSAGENGPIESLLLASYDITVAPEDGLTTPAGGVVIQNQTNFTDLSITNNGQYITYQAQQISGSTGALVSGQTGPNFGWNSFAFDQDAEEPSGENSLLSRVNGTTATTGNFNTTAAMISGEATAVAFVSQATNLSPSNLNSGAPIASNGSNLFVYPAFGAGPSLLSSQTVVQVNAETLVYGTSQDGRYVVFTSNSPTVISGQVDNNSDQDVFVYDRVTGVVTLVSHAAGEPLTTGNAGSPDTIDGTQPFGAPVVISEDGNWIAFVSAANDLVAGSSIPAQTTNLYLFDNEPGADFGTITLVSHLPGSETTSDSASSFDPAISADGRYISFVSYSKELVSGLTGQTGDFFKSNVFLYDQENPDQIKLLSGVNQTLTTGNGNSYGPSISDDGEYIAFQSYANDLLAGGATITGSNIYLFDQTSQTLTLVSHTPAGNSGNASSSDPVISADGSFVAFVSYATDLITGQRSTAFSNVFVYDNQAGGGGAVRLISGIDGSPTDSATGFSDSPALSMDGEEVAFRSDAPDLVSGQVNGQGSTSNIFLFNQEAGTVTLVSYAAGSATTTAAGDSVAPGINGDGDLVVFVSTATNLVTNQQGGGVDNAFLFSVGLGVNALLSGQGGSQVLASSTIPTSLAIISRDEIVALDILSGAGGTSAPEVNQLVQLALSSATILDGSAAGTIVGNLSVTETAYDGSFAPSAPDFTLDPEANSASFALGTDAGGEDIVFNASAPVNIAAQPSFTVVVQVNVLGQDGNGQVGIVECDGALDIEVLPRLTVTINQAASQADPTTATPINFTVTFSQPVIGFTTGDVTLGGTAGATTVTVTGSGAVYNVAVSGMKRSGTVLAALAANLVHDAAGVGNVASTSTDNSVTYDLPPLAITSANNVTFTGQNEASFTVTGTGNPIPTFTLAGQPTWLAIDKTTGVMSGTPSDLGAASSTFTFTITASNGVQTAATQSFTLTVNEGSSSITGAIYHDINHNGVQDAGEPGLAGVTVFLDMNQNGVLDGGEPTATTNASGAYVFSGLPAGSYTVRELLLGGVILSNPSGGSFAVTVASAATVSDQDFGNVLTSIAVPLILPPTSSFPSQGNANADYVEAVYRAVLDRNADSQGLAAWVADLNKGVPRLTVVQGIRKSPEHFAQEVTDYYETLLGRAPDANGLAAWVQELENGLPEEKVVEGFLDSPEYTGKGNKFFVDSMYESLLGRPFDPTGEQQWLAVLQATPPPYLEVVDGFLFSLESLQRLVEGYYEVYLGRQADTAGLNAWVQELQQGLAFTAIGDGFLASDEFYNNAGANG